MAATARNNVVAIRSIQGEQQSKAERVVVWAEPDDVDQYVDDVPDDYLPCRLGGHDIPPMPRNASVSEMFTELDANGEPIRRTVCRGCGKAERVEQWTLRGGRLRPVSSYLWFPAYLLKPGEPPYTQKPGHGRMRRADIRESLASLCVKGMSEAQIKKQLKKAFG